jgi:alkyldihydroxyacetonephosphate synthase
LPVLYDWFSKVIGASLERKSLPQPEMTVDQIPNVILNDAFVIDLKKTNIQYSDDPQDRLFRAHGKF